jgi:hypothetical protein
MYRAEVARDFAPSIVVFLVAASGVLGFVGRFGA